MNHPFRADDILAVAAPLIEPDPPILLGMPQLDRNGLSESWLLKELGHRHWMKLATSAGRDVPDFRDDAGNPVYAAFCAISITDADLIAAGENDRLVVASSLKRLSRTQVASRHDLSIDGRAIGTVEMVSTFVRRGVDGGNHLVARVAVDGLPPIESQGQGRALADRAAAFRTGAVSRHMGFDLRQPETIHSATFDPCPSQDFNGAGFLYFTSFLAFVDRAEWQFDRPAALTASTVRRDIFFRGNVNPGELVTVALLGRKEGQGTLAHHCRLYRSSDGAIVADVFTERAYR